MRRSWLAGAAALILAAAGAGVLHWSTTDARRSGRLDGICIALDMVMAHGLMDAPKRSMVADAIASPVNPYFDRLDVRRADIASRCRRVAEERWHWN